MNKPNKVEKKIETMAGNSLHDEQLVAGFYHFVKQGGYFNTGTLEKIRNEIILYANRNFPTKTEKSICRGGLEETNDK